MFDLTWFRWLCIALAMWYTCGILGRISSLIQSIAKRNNAQAKAIEDDQLRQEEALEVLKALKETGGGSGLRFGGMGN